MLLRHLEPVRKDIASCWCNETELLCQKVVSELDELSSNSPVSTVVVEALVKVELDDLRVR